ncbi:hypothetical protein BJ875DRAFT_479445 [Amylocarpus encephaloides]|uniref:Uncharacterized protein n=1 Tax=Amylocarpus encephaloides TaxID=45428 RepID=A0A9P7YT41_9HELO|nr:hypothetical protein BJ875DRAFT_479445 [Amylocarpus encephaloides]
MLNPLRLLSLLLTTALLLGTPVLALPASGDILTERGPVHYCSIWIQRWSFNAFDVAYYNGPLFSDGGPDNSVNFNNQETSEVSPGSQIDRVTIGSNDLIIKNVANPVVVGKDAGKVSFVYGGQVWNSWTPGRCVVRPGGAPGFTSYACNFFCDR